MYIYRDYDRSQLCHLGIFFTKLVKEILESYGLFIKNS